MSGGFNPGMYGRPGRGLQRRTSATGVGGTDPQPTAADMAYAGHEGADVDAALDARPPTHVLASTDPAATDDDGDGHVVGCRWINESSGEEFVAVDVSTGAAIWESTTSGTLDFGESGDISASAVGDTAAAGSTGEVADAGHRHAREAFGAVTAQTMAGMSSSNGVATTVARSDHTHGTPAATAAGGRLLIADVHGSPIVFDDILQADDYSDFLYSEA
jgi:hypothetical protein